MCRLHFIFSKLIFSYLLLYNMNNILAIIYKPHIIIIVADDLGWNDVSFHGSNQISTPNIDALAYNGVILNNLYAQPVCTPSRASLMTGKYPIHLGMQGQPILAAEPSGLPLSEKILPQYFKELGYITHAVGKWHLGFYRKDYTPTHRGFDSFFGYYAGFTSYYDHILQDVYDGYGDFAGYDLRKNEDVFWDDDGRYATDLFTDEVVDIIDNHDTDSPLFLYFAHLAVHAANGGKLLEAPQSAIHKFRHIVDPNRRTYAAMVSKLDESVGQIVHALQEKDMLKDSIILFLSDNGAPSANNGTPNTRNYPNWGSNFPFRGVKNTLWEGGVKSASFIWSSLFLQYPRIMTEIMHVSDLLPTLYTAAGGNPSRLPSDLDGVDHWYTLTLDLPTTVRKSLLINIDEKRRTAAARANKWKFVIGSTDNDEGGAYYNSLETHLTEKVPYNVTAVIESYSGRAIAEVANSLFLPTANEDSIRKSRYQATIKCPLLIDTINSNSRISCDVTPCLFNLENDPCERNNLIKSYPAISNKLYDMLKYYRQTLIPQINKPVDILQADPKLWNNTWSPWVL